MPEAKGAQEQVDLSALLRQSLQKGNPLPLERYLTGRSGLPGPRMNTALVTAFARATGQIVTRPDMPLVERLEALLDGWAALSLAEAPVNDPREMLPAAAVRAYGQVAMARPDWWEDEVAKLHRAASNPRWRTRELVAAALQGMLAVDWERTYQLLLGWVSEQEPLVIRAAAAAIAEPPLLNCQARGDAALAIQARATQWLVALSRERRREEPVAVLRKALGYTLSVAIAATPEAGFAWLEQLAGQKDRDIAWIVRQNLTKNRLQRWETRVQQVRDRLGAAPKTG